ncbi:MAG: trypsin-like peptidase domain-containing protein [Candidatus Sumerlaeia bacterium]|nr:trypsin-like peptidase domain-containing protein [Candidatus Sumerlaeia bacterium]
MINSKGRTALTSAAILAMGLLLVPAIGQADPRSHMRKVIEEKGDAVIRVEIVQNIKQSYQGQQYEQERKSEVNGFFVSEDGLLVTTLSTADQGQFYSSFTEGEDSLVTQVRAAKYILADNTEIPAAIVLRDTDRDIVFFKPLEERDEPYVHFELTETDHPKILEETFTLARMSRIARRTLLGMSGEIQGVITRPRAYYIPHGELGSSGTGTPMFNSTGELIGMGATYLFPGGRSAVGEQDESMLFIITPIIDILDILEDAMEATPEATFEEDFEEEETAEPEEEDAY